MYRVLTRSCFSGPLICIPRSCFQFVHGQREGAGRWTAKAGLVYVGEWRAGQMCGVGQSTQPDGTGELRGNANTRGVGQPTKPDGTGALRGNAGVAVHTTRRNR